MDLNSWYRVFMVIFFSFDINRFKNVYHHMVKFGKTVYLFLILPFENVEMQFGHEICIYTKCCCCCCFYLGSIQFKIFEVYEIYVSTFSIIASLLNTLSDEMCHLAIMPHTFMLSRKFSLSTRRLSFSTFVAHSFTVAYLSKWNWIK